MTERLPQHLQQKHELKRDDGKYKKYLSLAKVVSGKKPHIFLRMKAERESNIGDKYDQNSYLHLTPHHEHQNKISRMTNSHLMCLEKLMVLVTLIAPKTLRLTL